ncbi:MAG: ABC transporter permease [Alistipes sp.]|nr:ABC transporter permease [Alistipes sp.]
MHKEFFRTILNQWRTIFHDEGVILIMIAAPIIYATIYSLTYGTQVLRDIPIGVIDNSHTHLSRSLIEKMDAGANIYVAYEPCDMEEAKRLFHNRQIYGIVYIPSNFANQLLNNEQATLSLYLDASYMLMYRQTFQELAALISTQNATIEYSNLLSAGINPPQAQAITTPVRYNSHTLFNPYLGYGTFIMPPIIILILQQTLLIGAGMIAATRHKHEATPLQPLATALLILGKATAYTLIYTIIALYLINIHFKLFHYPCNGTALDLTIFLGLYLFVCSLLAVAISALFKRREASLMTLLWSSIPLLMLSGASYPHQSIPKVWQLISLCFPSTHGINGFSKIQTAGASISEAWREVNSLVVLGVVFFVIASLQSIYSNKKASSSQSNNKLSI